MTAARLLLTAFAFSLTGLFEPALASPQEPRVPTEVLVLRSAARFGGGRSLVHLDALEAQIVAGHRQEPNEGDLLASPAGEERRWERVKVEPDGSINRTNFRAGYVYWPVVMEQAGVWMLQAVGHSLVYVNGDIRAGDPYGYGYLRTPVLLQAGTNHLLFQAAGRGGFNAKLGPPTGPLMIDKADPTLPDIVVGEQETLWGAVVVVNATPDWAPITLRAGGKTRFEQHARLAPLSSRKVPFRFQPRISKNQGVWELPLEVSAAEAKTITQATFELRVRKPDQTVRRTFISDMDGSVQYYAVNPPPSYASTQDPAALFLSLHGAGVEALGQADSYSPKRWGYLVCPTNRRPYGFDWEEWGRSDALEVLDLARARFNTDPQRTYLTGHSMGGHGTWQIGATYPDRFAALGPSAGWISFMSYAARGQPAPTNDVQRLMRRAANQSDTLLMATNYLQQGVYIVHGDADTSVPVSEAREMRRVLGEFHRDLDFHEQPGAGHWWDASDEPGTDCVDWGPMFDFFARRQVPSPATVRRVRFVTLNPVVSHRCFWVSILGQEHSLLPSSVDVRCEPTRSRILGTTTNVLAIRFAVPGFNLDEPVTVQLDGQTLNNLPVTRPERPAGRDQSPAEPFVCLTKQSGAWGLGTPPSPTLKNPTRSGPFREAFRNRMVFVFGTQGTPEENAWSLNRARYDAEGFYYRGNGSVEVMSDVSFLAGIEMRKRVIPSLRERSVILYGNAEGNAAWSVMLDSSPVQVHRGAVRVGDRRLSGDNLACLFLQPSPLSDRALVGVVGGSGLPGLKLTERLPYFVAGVAIPDCFVAGTEMLTNGSEGIRVAGFFGPDWQVASGDFAWNNPAEGIRGE